MCVGIPDHGLPIRLVSFGEDSTSTGRGRVEVFARRTWGSICDDGWNIHAANVTCRALGFVGAERIAEVEEFGKGTGHVWLDDMKCSGNEISLDFCTKYGLGRTDCVHSEDAGVVCISEYWIALYLQWHASAWPHKIENTYHLMVHTFTHTNIYHTDRTYILMHTGGHMCICMYKQSAWYTKG